MRRMTPVGGDRVDPKAGTQSGRGVTGRWPNGKASGLQPGDCEFESRPLHTQSTGSRECLKCVLRGGGQPYSERAHAGAATGRTLLSSGHLRMEHGLVVRLLAMQEVPGSSPGIRSSTRPWTGYGAVW